MVKFFALYINGLQEDPSNMAETWFHFSAEKEVTMSWKWRKDAESL